MSLNFLVLALFGFSVATSELTFSRRRESKERMILGGVHRMEMPQGRDSGCPSGNTCLYTNRCCPLPYAQSCADAVHCCPSNTSCNAVRGECEALAPSGEVVAVPWERTSVQPCAPAADANSERPQRKLALPPRARNGRMNVQGSKGKDNQVCPDTHSSCADDQTCCQLESGSYGCCPLQEAVCCSDHEHCCPSGYTCDMQELRCLKSSFSRESRRHPLVALLSRDATVKTGKASMPTKAGVDATLTQLEAFVALFARDRVRPRNLPLLPNANNECPDHKSECDEGTTCCLLDSGKYGCCPMPDAVCCSDKEHCCPQDTECDLEHQRCIRKQVKSESATTLMKYPLTAVANEPKRQTNGSNVVCPDGRSYCQDYQTCCLLRSGSYGCCPYSSAVCCADYASCCPYGYVCNIQTHQCLRASDDLSKKSPSPPAPSSKWVAHSSAPASKVEDEKDNQIVCPDHQSSCPDGSTCCQLASGAYGCCPMPNAVCCSDKEHCCPNGTTCDLVYLRCVRSPTNVEEKVVPTKALKDVARVAMVKSEAANGSNVVCPDGRSYCQDSQTCCLLRSGSYGCCPYSSAVCCADLASCCPYGYVCNIQTHQCLRSGAPKEQEGKPAETSSALSVVLSSEEASSEEKSNQLCPDQKSACPDQTTCCQLSSGEYGCCPLPKAVCCSDKEHCCPEDTTCDVEHERCLRGNPLLNELPEFVPMRRKLPARLISRKPESTPKESAAVPSGTGSACPDGHSCCNGNTCCALYNAKCCADGKHCCPSNTVCNLAKGTCDTPAPGVWVPWERVYSVASCN